MNNKLLKIIIAILAIIAISLITIIIQNNSNSSNSRYWEQVEDTNFDRAEACARNRQIEIVNCNNDSACLQRLMNKYAGTSCGD